VGPLVRQEVDYVNGDPAVVGAKLVGVEMARKVERVRANLREGGKGISTDLLKVLMP